MNRLPEMTAGHITDMVMAMHKLQVDLTKQKEEADRKKEVIDCKLDMVGKDLDHLKAELADRFQAAQEEAAAHLAMDQEKNKRSSAPQTPEPSCPRTPREGSSTTTSEMALSPMSALLLKRKQAKEAKAAAVGETWQ